MAIAGEAAKPRRFSENGNHATLYTMDIPAEEAAFAEDARACYLRGQWEGAERAWRAAGKEGDLPEEEPNGEGSGAKEALERMSVRMEWASEGFADLARKLELENAKGAWALWEAFGNFCWEELGMEPKKLVKMWFEAVLPEVEELEARTQDVEVGREEVEKNEAAIEEGWRKLMEG